MTDVVLGAVLTNGRDDFRTGRKVTGHDARVGELTTEQQRDYFRPFVASAERHSVHAVVLHDGLSDAVMDGLPVRFCCAVALPDWNAFERRWVAALNWLHARDDVRRVWMVDANDVLFVGHPFRWMDSHIGDGRIAVGREAVTMGGNHWFEAGVKPLPREYADVLTKKYGSEYGLSCGCWGADRATAIAVLTEAVERIESMQRFLARNKPRHPVCLDMFAFGVVWRERYAERLVPFAMDGETAVNGVPSPILHDRGKCVERLVYTG